jgi:hypothetical protein
MPDLIPDVSVQLFWCGSGLYRGRILVEVSETVYEKGVSAVVFLVGGAILLATICTQRIFIVTPNIIPLGTVRKTAEYRLGRLEYEREGYLVVLSRGTER